MSAPPRRRASRPARASDADPLGKRALFSPPPAPTTRVDPFAPAEASGHAPDRAGGLATIRCEACHRTTAVGARDLVVALVPSVWIPWRRPSRFLRCPACGRLTWAEVTWGALRR